MNRIVTTYDYRSKQGDLLYQNVRFEPKDFRLRRPDGNGGWIWELNGTPRVLYRLPEIYAASKQDWIIIVEGEKDAETLRSLGFEATTSGNATSWHSEFALDLAGRLVCVLPDNDKAGTRYATDVCDSLVYVAGEVRLGQVPGAVKDITEYTESRDGADEDTLRAEVLRIIETAKPVTTRKTTTPAETPKIVVEDGAAWLTTEPEPSDQIVAGLFDRGDKVANIGSSKLRKSFLTLQEVLSIAAGRDFLDWKVPKARRVFLAQFEVQANHFHRRVRRMATALGITTKDLGDRLKIVNGRGLGLCGAAGVRAIMEAAKPFTPDLMVFDPLYKISSGIENAAEDAKIMLGLFDELAETLGAAILYVHHDPKGTVGDRDIRDRGAGSNVISRDYDACFALTPHAAEPDAVVLEILTRNYPPQDPRTIQWAEDFATGGYRFDLRPDLEPTKRTSATKAKEIIPFEDCWPTALSLFDGGPREITHFRDLVQAKLNINRDRTRAFVRWALLKPNDPLAVYETRGKGTHEKWIGTADQIARKQAELEGR
jgi:putative DNA primase/helicase